MKFCIQKRWFYIYRLWTSFIKRRDFITLQNQFYLISQVKRVISMENRKQTFSKQILEEQSENSSLKAKDGIILQQKNETLKLQSKRQKKDKSKNNFFENKMLFGCCLVVFLLLTFYLTFFYQEKNQSTVQQPLKVSSLNSIVVEKFNNVENNVQIKQEVRLSDINSKQITDISQQSQAKALKSNSQKDFSLVGQSDEHIKASKAIYIPQQRPVLSSALNQPQAYQNIVTQRYHQASTQVLQEKRNGDIPRYQKDVRSSYLHGISQNQIIQSREYVELKNMEDENQISKKQREYYQKKYKINNYDKEIPICVVIPTYNNIQNDRYKNNMNSIIQQEYQNYHIVFIDDGSTDETFSKTQQLLIQKNFSKNKIRMIKNQVQMFAMHNLRRAAMQFCKPQQIFIIVDGDDKLIGRQVFKLYNALFQNTGAYFVYTNFLISANGQVGYSRQFPDVIKQRSSYRSHQFSVSHLRAFYTKLFQLVKQSDLKDEKGEYYRAANDVAICFPILQMSGQKVEYFPQLTYWYNSATGYNNHAIRVTQQRSNEKKVRKKLKYKVIAKLFEQLSKEQN